MLADTERLQRERQDRRAQWIEAKSQLETLQAATESHEKATLAEEQSREDVEESQEKLRHAQQNLARYQERHKQAAKQLESIKKSQAAMEKLSESVNAGEPELIPDSEIAELKKSVELARAAESAGEIQRKNTSTETEPSSGSKSQIRIPTRANISEPGHPRSTGYCPSKSTNSGSIWR
jgi:multidrug resistance efflux pump